MDLGKDELNGLLDLAIKIKTDYKNGVAPPYLKDKTLGMIFEKASTRTRVSFEVGMVQLGGYPLFLSSNDLQMGRGEPIEDTARVLSRMLDGIMIRTFAQETVETLAKHAEIPVINGLTDFAHPCQILADFMTVKEHKGSLEGKKFAFIGDGNNMANSIIAGCAKLGISISVACPTGYAPDSDICFFAKKNCDFTLTDDIFAAAKDADVLFTDVYTSMGQEAETEKRKEAFKGFTIDEKLMKVAKSDAMVMHCLPAHRGEEISAEVFEAHANEIFDEAENRLHAQKAVLVELMGTK